jgi:hypothetical protein
VFWWFEKSGQFTRCEVLQIPSGGYELRVVEPSGAERVEHFESEGALAARRHDVEAQLRTAGWNGPHGWVL